MKIFYDTAWRAFEAPEKPTLNPIETRYTFVMNRYEKAYALAKENALLVGNEQVLRGVIVNKCQCPCHRYRGMMHIAPCCDGGYEFPNPLVDYDWPYKAVIRDGKYYLSI